MSDLSSKPRNSNILAACIVGASLVASALIVTRPQASAGQNNPTASKITALASPPFAQDDVKEQFRARVLAAPTLQTYKFKGKTFTLSDIDVTRVTYDADKDCFTVSFHWVWKEGKVPESWDNSSNLYNDGYGHYWGPVVLSPILNGTGQNAEVTIK